jgi:hypothetical protein
MVIETNKISFTTKLGEDVREAFKGTGVPHLEDMADFVTGHGCECPPFETAGCAPLTLRWTIG